MGTYSKQHNLPKLLGTLLEELVVYRPDDPVSFLIDYLESADKRRDAKKAELLFELYEHINSNEDPQVTMPQWLQEINRGTFAKPRFPLHSNQLLKVFLDLYEAIEEEQQPDDQDAW